MTQKLSGAIPFYGGNRFMAATDTLQQLTECGIVAVIRAESSHDLVEVSRALSQGGVRAIEITMTVPNAIETIKQVSTKLGKEIILGAGTVLDSKTASECIEAGAEFVVSPAMLPDVIRTCQNQSVLAVPGALTPTEIVQAWQAGAEIVKVFPSEFFGPKYIKALRGPFPHIPLLPTGGVTLDTAREFLEAGANVLGVGGSLVSPQMIRAKEFDKMTYVARQFKEILRSFRAQ